MRKHFLFTSLVALVFLNCTKTITKNSFENVTTLDCRNLIVRKITLNSAVLEVTIENTCKSCKEWNVYSGIAITNRQNYLDTLAQSPSLFSFSPPDNGKTVTYKLETQLTNPPNLNNAQINFNSICKDLSYLPE